jgi:hypothetical protein
VSWSDVVAAAARLPSGDPVRVELEREAPGPAAPALRVVVVGEGARCAALADVLHGHSPLRSSLGRELPARRDVDAWVLALEADQVGSLREKAFVRGLERLAATHLLVHVSGLDRVPEDRRADVSAFARRVFSEVPEGHFSDTDEALRHVLGVWSTRAAHMRREVELEVATRLAEVVRLARSQAEERLAEAPDLDRRERELRAWELRAETAVAALETGHVQLAPALRLEKRWSAFVDALEASRPKGIGAPALELEIASWARRELLPEVQRQLESYVAAAWNDLGPPPEIGAASFDWAPELPESAGRPMWARAGLPTAAGVIAALLRGPWVGLIAAGVTGLLVAATKGAEPDIYAQLRSDRFARGFTSAVAETLAEALAEQVRASRSALATERSRRTADRDLAEGFRSARVTLQDRVSALGLVATALSGLMESASG